MAANNSDEAAEGPAAGDGAASGESRAATPSVTAVIVAHDPGDWFSETLSSFAAQDYPRLDLLVVDASGAAGLAEQVRARAPMARIVDASDTAGFAEAANAVLETDATSALYLICHDDVAPEPDAVRLLVAESLRSNAGVTGPKLVDWDNPERLQHVGLVVDRFADAVDVVDASELDQQQYDNVADVFAVPSACMLVRRALFEAIGGFDPAMIHRGEDVDLCWRAQLAGARVIVAPDAVVRHRSKIAARPADLRGRRVRHQLRTVLVNSSRPMLALNVPLMALLAVGEALIALGTFRFGHIRNLVDGWTWNLSSLGAIRRRRRMTKATIEVPHRDVRALQALGSVRVNAVLRARLSPGERSLGHGLASAMRTGTTRFVVLTWSVAAVFVLFGSRTLIADGPAAVGDFAAFGASGGDLLADWWGSWHDRDLGSPGALATGLGIAGAVAWATGTGLARTLLVVGPVVVGLVGIWRLLADTASRRAQMAALLGYLIVPLAWTSIATASNPGLVGYAAAPFVLRALLRAEAAEPYGRPVKDVPRSAQWMQAVTGAGIAAGLALMFAPDSALLLPVTALGLLAGSILAARPTGLHRLAAGAVIAAATSLLLVLPLTLDVARVAGGGGSPSDVWAVVSGGRSAGASANASPLADILRFDAGTAAVSPLLWLLAPAALLALLVGSAWRFELAVRLWCVAGVGWALAFVAARGAVPFSLGDPALLLAPAAAAVAGLCGLGVVSVEHDLRRTRLGLGSVAAAVAALGAIGAAVPALALVETGRWDLPRAGFADVVPFEDPAVAGSYRVVWIGDPEVLPAGGRELGFGMAYAATLDRGPQITDRDVAVDPGSVDVLAGVIGDIVAGDTQRAGRLLGGLGVRYLVVLERLAPAPFSSADQAVPAPAGLTAALGRQLDLRHLSGVNSAMQIYENTEWTSLRAAAAPGFDSDLSVFGDLSAEPLRGTFGVLFGRGDRLSGSIPDGTEVFVAQTPDDGWRLEIGGQAAIARQAAGWATAFVPDPGTRAAPGEAAELTQATELWHASSISHRLATLLQIAGWVVIVGLGLRRRLGSGTAP